VIGRREFITLLGGAMAWPLAARAQQAGNVPVMGLFESKSARDSKQPVAAFHRGLNEAAFIEGQNVACWSPHRRRLPSRMPSGVVCNPLDIRKAGISRLKSAIHQSRGPGKKAVASAYERFVIGVTGSCACRSPSRWTVFVAVLTARNEYQECQEETARG
jgi:hypothetical protein